MQAMRRWDLFAILGKRSPIFLGNRLPKKKVRRVTASSDASV